MIKDILSQRDNILTRRLILEPGEAMWWHTDLCTRYTVTVLQLSIRPEWTESVANPTADSLSF